METCETCKNYNLYDEEAIKIDKNLQNYGVCIYNGTEFHKKSLCKHYIKKE